MSENYIVPEDMQYTVRGEEFFYTAADLESFREKSPQVIIDLLEQKLRPVPFCAHLKRYIHRKAKMSSNMNEISDEDYVEYIKTSFKENGTPPSFDPNSTTKISAAAKNWIKQPVVSRKTVFLLGFGLGMTADEVSAFLKKGILEGDFYFKNPYEIIYHYCYENGFGFEKARELTAAYEESLAVVNSILLESQTLHIRTAFMGIKDSGELLDLLKSYNLNLESTVGFTAKSTFNKLYDECRKIIAVYKQAEEDRIFDEKVEELKGNLLRSKRLFDFERKNLLKSYKEERPFIIYEDITESDVEKYLCSGTPTDKHGNLTKISVSSLAGHFFKKRLSKQRLTEINSGNSEVDRFDLITLKFYICAERDAALPGNSRWWNFVEETNTMLAKCSMGELYTANPYDCFLQLCMLSDVPLATYDEVMEMSYSKE